MSDVMTMERKCQFEAMFDASFIELIRLVPCNPYVRALILKLVGQMPGSELETFDQLKDWIEGNCTHRVRPMPNQHRQRSADGGISINVEFSETENGRADYSVSRSGNDEFRIGAEDLIEIVQEVIEAGGSTRSYEALRFVSRVLFLGPSFFTALLQPSTQLEADADQIAVRLLETNGASRQDLMEALRQIEQNQMASLLPWGLRHGVAIAPGPTMDWMPASLRTAMESESHQTFSGRLITRWRLLFYLTQHSDLAGYTYESFSERIDRISKLS